MKSLKRFAFLGLAIVTVSAVDAATALAALPEFLGTLPNAFTTSGGTAEFFGHGLATLKCTSSGSSAGNEITNSKQGIWDELFLGCTEVVAGITVKCTGVKDSVAGSILEKGTYTLGYELGTLKPVLVLSFGPEVEFKCSASAVKLRGCFAGKITPKSVLTTKLLLVGTRTPIEDYTNDKSESIKCELLESSGGPFTLAVQIVQTSLTYSHQVELMA